MSDAIPPTNTGNQYIEQLLREIMSPATHPLIVQLLYESALSPEDIHPIFAHRRWTNISDMDFLRLLPGVVLASRLLICGRALHFWHAFMFGRQTQEYDDRGRLRVRFHPVCDTTVPLSDDEKAKVLRNLQDMSHAISLCIAEPSEEEEEEGSATGTRPLSDLRFFALYQGPGIQTSINIGGHKLEALDVATCSAAELLNEWVSLANTLIHEVAHAVDYAFRGRVGESFVADQTFGEMGYALQKWLFDGSMHPQYTEWEEPIIMYIAQPAKHLVLSYRQGGHDFPLSAVPEIASDRAFILDKTWTESLFLRATWQTTIPSRGVGVLTPPVEPCTCHFCAQFLPDTRASLIMSRAEYPCIIRHGYTDVAGKVQLNIS